MSEENKLPKEWIDRIFLRLELKFKEKGAFAGKLAEELAKEQWASGLARCSAKEIKEALRCCDRLIYPPTVIEFYHFAKGFIPPPIKKEKNTMTEESKQKGREVIASIKKKLKC